ncbi:thiamine phosphate synthase [Sphingomonas sp.]|jgi:thiamine-phosphate pyrophosphorylase|uniref:thiamine phosphate synthase n=1 Tax=Sphingomonas sp. TaxID=28214 RepID=UPI002EDA52BC
MRARNPVPKAWLMTDERLGDDLWAALARVPPGSGVVFRHLATPRGERLALFRRVRSVAVARRLVLVVAGERLPWRAHHGGPRPATAPAHDRREAVAGVRRGARALFVSPVFATRTHPGARGLGIMRARQIGLGLPLVAVALGGMDARRWRGLRGFWGWAGIDAWV